LGAGRLRRRRADRPCGWLVCHAEGRVSLRGLEVDHQTGWIRKRK
jgi:hypothetical protein